MEPTPQVDSLRSMPQASKRMLIAGNWKMHGRLESARALAEDIAAAIRENEALRAVDWLICPPFVHLPVVAAALQRSADASSDINALAWSARQNDKTTVGRQHAKDIPLYLGAQNLAAQSDGAWTGEVSGPMLLDCGCAAVILGHSERRQHFYETDAMIATKLCLAIASGLMVLLCVGESEQARREGRTEAVIAKQLEVLTELPPGQREAAFQPVIAYEPLWAIGSGRSANPEDAQKVHASIRKQMLDAGFAAAHLRILYGGSVKPENAAALFAMPDIDGALVGGAALEAKQFLAIGEAAIRRIIAPVPEERKSWPG